MFSLLLRCGPECREGGHQDIEGTIVTLEPSHPPTPSSRTHSLISLLSHNSDKQLGVLQKLEGSTENRGLGQRDLQAIRPLLLEREETMHL